MERHGQESTQPDLKIVPKQNLSQGEQGPPNPLEQRIDWRDPTMKQPTKYDQLPLSKNIDDRRKEYNEVVKNATSIDDLLNKLEAMGGKDEDPADARRYYKEMIKEENITDPIARKAGILDLINEIKNMK